jgi:putative ABC transport system substrate-binding protein
MQRRQFISLIGGAAPWPLLARAQQGERVRRIGVLSVGVATQNNLTAFRDGLAKLGWAEGRNLRVELRFGAGDPNRYRAYATEFANLSVDVILVDSGASTRAMQQQTARIPIVFVTGGDPAVNGLVKNIARPEGNTTGITNFFGSIGGKWLDLLKGAAPNVVRVAVIFNPEASLGSYFASIDAAAPLLAMQTIKTPIHDAVDTVRAIDAFAAQPNGALLVVPDPVTGLHRETIVKLAIQHRLPTMYSSKISVTEGGLMSYGPDLADLYKRAASYVDRILRGTQVSELPVQFPTAFDLAINLKTAKAIGLEIPQTMLALANEVIQ